MCVSTVRREGWSEWLAGEMKKIEGPPPDRQAFGAGGNQGRPPMQYSDGRRLAKVDFDARVLVVADPPGMHGPQAVADSPFRPSLIRRPPIMRTEGSAPGRSSVTVVLSPRISTRKIAPL